MEGEAAGEEGGIQEGVSGGDDEKADGVVKESLGEPSYSESSSIALFQDTGPGTMRMGYLLMRKAWWGANLPGSIIVLTAALPRRSSRRT